MHITGYDVLSCQASGMSYEEILASLVFAAEREVVYLDPARR